MQCLTRLLQHEGRFLFRPRRQEQIRHPARNSAAESEWALLGLQGSWLVARGQPEKLSCHGRRKQPQAEIVLGPGQSFSIIASRRQTQLL